MKLKTLLVTYDLQPPWDSGLKVYGRGLMSSLQKMQGIEVSSATIDSSGNTLIERDGRRENDIRYDYVHVVLTGLRPLSSALKKFHGATIFKHIVTPSVGFRNAISTKICYGILNGLENRRLVRCFSSKFVAESYMMQGERIIPPSVDTTRFAPMDTDEDQRRNVISTLEKSTTAVGLENLQSRSDCLTLLYSGPLTQDRFPYQTVLGAIKSSNSKILIVGRPTNGGADAGRLDEILSYSQKIGIESRLAITSKILTEEEKVSLINYSDIVIQPFAKSTQLYVAVDPPIFLLEAMACGRPVITSRSYSFQSLIKNGYNGYAIDWENPRELKDALNDCQRITTTKLGTNARQTVLQDFSHSSVSEKLKVMYNDYN